MIQEIDWDRELADEEAHRIANEKIHLETFTKLSLVYALAREDEGLEIYKIVSSIIELILESINEKSNRKDNTSTGAIRWA